MENGQFAVDSLPDYMRSIAFGSSKWVTFKLQTGNYDRKHCQLRIYRIIF